MSLQLVAVTLQAVLSVKRGEDYEDGADESEIWIGYDLCDSWYHLSCEGLRRPPKEEIYRCQQLHLFQQTTVIVVLPIHTLLLRCPTAYLSGKTNHSQSGSRSEAVRSQSGSCTRDGSTCTSSSDAILGTEVIGDGKSMH